MPMMYNKKSFACSVVCATLILAGVVQFVEGIPPCCELRRLYEDEGLISHPFGAKADDRRLYEAEVELFPDGNYDVDAHAVHVQRRLDCGCNGSLVNSPLDCICPTLDPTGSPSKSPVTSDPTGAPVTLDPTGSPSKSPVTSVPTSNPSTSPVTDVPTSNPSKSPSDSPVTDVPTSNPSTSPVTDDPTGAPVTLDPTNTPTQSPESTNPTQSPESPESTSTTTTTKATTTSTKATTTTTTKATTTTTPEATTTTTSTTTSDGEDPDKPTLHDAIYSLSKCIHSSSHWNPQTYKAHLAKLVLILADKNNSMNLKVTKAEYAAKVLGCPEVSGCYGSVCEEIEKAVSALGDKEPVRERKLRGNWEGMECDPWTYPNTDKAKLLAADPGVWTVDNFLDDEEVDKLSYIFQKHIEDIDSPCSVDDDGRKCLYINPNDLEYGQEYLMQIRTKVGSLWPQFDLSHGTGVYNVPKGKTDAIGYHLDHWVVTAIVFLSDDDGQGAKAIFPLAGPNGLTVTPKKGMALTWITKHEDGKLNENHSHGFQGTTPDSKEKVIMVHNFVISPEELLNVAGEEGTRTCRNLKGVP